MAMSKKYYIAFAQAILDQRGRHEYSVLTVDKLLDILVEKLIPIFEADNPQFDADKFRGACR